VVNPHLKRWTWIAVGGLVIAGIVLAVGRGHMSMSDTVSSGLLHLLEVLAPAAAALFGVGLANRNSAKQLAAQLREAAREATRAREFSARREVYLDAAEAVATGHSTVGGMLDVTISDADIRSSVNATMGKLAKVNVIGQVSTLRAVADYTCALTDALLKLWLPRVQLQNADRTVRQLQAQLDAHSAEQARWIEMMKQANVQAAAGKNDPQVMQMFQRQFELAQKQFHEAARQQADAFTSKRKIHADSLETQIEQLKNLQRLLPAALAAARSEMELTVDLAEVTEIFEQVARRGEAATRELVAQAERLTASPQQKPPPPLPPLPPPGGPAPALGR